MVDKIANKINKISVQSVKKVSQFTSNASAQKACITPFQLAESQSKIPVNQSAASQYQLQEQGLSNNHYKSTNYIIPQLNKIQSSFCLSEKQQDSYEDYYQNSQFNNSLAKEEKQTFKNKEEQLMDNCSLPLQIKKLSQIQIIASEKINLKQEIVKKVPSTPLCQKVSSTKQKYSKEDKFINEKLEKQNQEANQAIDKNKQNSFANAANNRNFLKNKRVS